MRIKPAGGGPREEDLLLLGHSCHGPWQECPRRRRSSAGDMMGGVQHIPSMSMFTKMYIISDISHPYPLFPVMSQRGT